jgi:hypothetical protein
MRAYQEELERYKQTENYQKYQIYLEAFNHRRQSMGNRRPSDGTVQFGRWIPSDTNAPLAAAPASLTPQLPSLTQQDPNGDQEMDLDIYEHGLEGQPHDATSPVKCGMSEVRAISKALGINPHTLRVAAYPSEEVTTKAIEDFLGGTGSLIYLWDREGANSLIKAVYDSQNDGAPIHAAEVFAMAAVGSYCDGDLGISYHRERFLEFFICLMSLPSAMCDLRRMRLFACLAICRFTNNVLSARKLMRELPRFSRPRDDRLTARSGGAQHWKANVHLALLSYRAYGGGTSVLVEHLSKHSFPGKVRTVSSCLVVAILTFV